MIHTTWKSERPRRAKDGDVKRYVRWDAIHGYVWCEKQEHSRFDLAQGYCSAEDVPDDVRAKADERRGYAFGYVEWPYAGALATQGLA